MRLASVLNASNALRYPGQEYPFTADAVVEDMEFAGDPISFRDIKVAGEMVGTGEKNARKENCFPPTYAASAPK